MKYETPTPKEISDGLLAARALMNGKGGSHWIKSTLKRVDWFGRVGNKRAEACYCSAGAIFEVAGPNKRLATAMLKQLASTIAGHKTTRRHNALMLVFGFNDPAYRQWADVSKKFRQAAKDALKS